jgi:hypothetical protein
MILKIESIGQLGRSQGIRLIIQLQRGGTDVISSKLRGNLQSRILLRVDNNDGVKMCLGSLDYLEKVGNVSPTEFGPGRFIFIDNSSPKGVKVHYGQSSFITPNEYINTGEKVGIKIGENNPPKTNEKNLTHIKPLTKEKTSSISIKTTKTITHSDNVNLRKELFSLTSKIIDEKQRKDIRSELVKINTLIKTEKYNIINTYNILKDLGTQIKKMIQ